MSVHPHRPAPSRSSCPISASGWNGCTCCADAPRARYSAGWVNAARSTIGCAVACGNATQACVLAHQAQRLDDFEQRLRHLARGALERRAARLQSARRHLWQLSPAARLRELVSRRLHLTMRLTSGMRRRLDEARGRRDLAARALNSVSPLATLERGYAIVTRASDGTLVRDASQVTRGDRIRARLTRGEIEARVEGMPAKESDP